MSDLIDRKKAIDATWFEPTYTDPLNVLTEVRDRLEALPPAQPERKKGKWKKWWEVKPDGFGGEVHIPHWACAECGTEYSPHLTSAVHYCVNCGVQMEVATE